MTTCDDHTPIPVSYLARSIWAYAMLARGKTQHKCDECGLWAVWRDGRGVVRRSVFLTSKEVDGALQKPLRQTACLNFYRERHLEMAT